jgi:16S rRNA (cytosine967-C5)-methyltransferase
MGEVLAAPSTPADLIISRFFAARRYLGSHDRGHISDAVYGSLRTVLRTRMMLEKELGQITPDHEAAIVIAIRLIEQHGPGVAQRISEPTGLRSEEMAFIVDHVSMIESTLAATEEPLRSALRHGLPLWFVERIIAEYGQSESDRLLAALNTQAPITLRVNTLLTDRHHLLDALERDGIPARAGEWSPDAVHLSRRMNAYSIPVFRQGWFEMQDEGSQLLSILLDPHPNWRVFDACAGAGGKTLHLAALMKGRGDLVAHDTNARRLAEIRPRLRRSGAQNVRVMENPAYLERRESFAGTFNAVLIDAPCSGTGVLRRNPGMRLVLEPEMVERIRIEQSQILDEYSRLVRPDGILLYATCSLLREENEDQVEAFLERNPGWSRQALAAPASMVTPDGYFHCWPHQHGTDGFFAALLKPPG